MTVNSSIGERTVLYSGAGYNQKYQQIHIYMEKNYIENYESSLLMWIMAKNIIHILLLEQRQQLKLLKAAWTVSLGVNIIIFGRGFTFLWLQYLYCNTVEQNL